MSTKTHTLSNGALLDVFVLTGEVLESNKLKHTTLHQGKATVGANYVVPGKVHSQVHTEHQVWLRDSSGKEHAVDFEYFDVPVREGHQVSVVYAGITDSDVWKIVRITNHTTDQWSQQGKLCEYLQLEQSGAIGTALLLFGVPIAIAVAALFVSEMSSNRMLGNLALWVVWGVAPACFVFIAWHLSKKTTRLNTEVDIIVKGTSLA